MSKIHKALNKLQEQGALGSRKASGKSGAISRRRPESTIPIAGKKSIQFDGPKHHLDEETLIRRGLLAALDQGIPVADEFRRLKRPLIDNYLKNVSEPNGNMNLIVVTSPLPGDGKTFCAVNLAASISVEQDLMVLLIDADVVKQDISNAFGLGKKPGLVDLLHDSKLSIDDVLIRTDLNDLQVLPAGQKHSQLNELLASERMVAIMHELTSRYPDRILIADSPPMLATSEASVIARQAGQIALVVEYGVTTDVDIDESLAMLDADKAINIILNKSRYASTHAYYRYDYGHGGFNEED